MVKYGAEMYYEKMDSGKFSEKKFAGTYPGIYWKIKITWI